MKSDTIKSIDDLQKENESLRQKISDLEKQIETHEFSLYSYPKVVENAPIAFTRVLNETQGYALTNKEFTNQSGFTREEFNALSDAEIMGMMHEDDVEGFLKAHRKWCDNNFKDTFRYIYRIANRSGRLIWLDVYYYAELAPDGEPYAVDQIYIDITDRIIAEEKLKESENKYRKLAESVPAAIFIFSGRRFIYCNDYSSEITGYSREELFQMDFWDIVHPDFRELAMERGFQRQRGEDIPARYEMKILDKNGNAKWMDYTGSLIEYQNKPSVLGVAYDITELKNTQHALIDSEQKYRALVENMSEVILYVDNRDRIVFVNDNAIKFFGYSRSELIGANAAELLAAEDFIDFVNEKVSQRQHGNADRYEVKMKHKSGQEMWVEVSGAPLKDSSGEVIGSIGIYSNITERREYADALEKSLRQKDLLLKEIHHRVKNNLQIVSSLIKLQSAHITDKEVHNLFAESQNRIKTMALIHEKLYRSTDISVIEFYDYIKNLVNNLYSTYGISIDRVKLVIEFRSIYLDIDTSIPCGLIVNELISNCLKYAFPGKQSGSIYIDLKETGRNNFLLIVKDDGVGIPPEIDFSSASSLGLKLVKILAEQLSGGVELIRTKGSEFRISFKMANYIKRTE